MQNHWDDLLNIRTSGRDDTIANQLNYPYEPTPYRVLERLAKSEYIGKKNVLLDYGCGKGRVDFYLSYETRCKVIGIDYDERMIEVAMANKERAYSGNRVEFVCANATSYEVPKEVDRCYFFNPFSIEILRGAVEKLMESYYENPRDMLLFFYYPSSEFVGFLNTSDEISFIDEISCEDLYGIRDERETSLIYKIG